jgi:hypothetical protein
MSTAPASFDLAQLRFKDAVSMGQSVRALTASARSADEAAQTLVSFLYDALRTGSGPTAPRACALVRCFVTARFGTLPPSIQTAALAAYTGPEPPLPTLGCLTLLGTRGELPEWNAPETSAGHRAIPLPNAAMIERAPMVARLLRELGISPEEVVSPPANIFLETEQRSFNVFHVEEARDSSYIPAQETFVRPYGIRSIVGMGGRLASGEFFAVVLFTRVYVSREVAELFRTLALSVKLALLPLEGLPLFASPNPSVGPGRS